MAIKREMSDFEPESEAELENESGSEFEPAHEIQVDIKPTPPKKTKTQPKTQSKTPGSSQKKRPASSPHSGSSVNSPSPSKKSSARVGNEAKRTIAESIIKIGSAGIDVDKLSKAVSPSCHLYC